MGTGKVDNRNYTIDFIRVIAAVLMTTFHWVWFVVFPGKIDNGYWGAYQFTQDHSFANLGLGLENWHWFKGTYTMGFFVFVTGFFMMEGFKKMQAKGAFLDNRTHFTYTGRFAAKTYCGYAPLMLFGTTFGWILANAMAAAKPLEWFKTFMWNIWQFIGVSGFGMFQNYYNEGAQGAYMAGYNGPTWYIAAFIAFGCVFYAILIRSERIAVFVVCPIMFAASNIWLNQWLDPETGSQITFGITTLLPQDVVRLWSPLALGVWGWYLADAIRKAKMTKNQETALGFVWLGLLVYALVTSWTGYFGGMLNQDVIWMLIAMFAIVKRDPITNGLNNIFKKFPLSKWFADFSAGLYLVHMPILLNFQKPFIEKFGLQNASWFFELMCVCGAIMFVLINRYALKPMYGKLSKMLHARDAVTPAIYGEAPKAVN